ncbi:hypothetical protein RND81_11G157000 [Saponaria officinalis]|uniref:Glycosyltransferase n=1 Tax=Saponaria officinalis TaxID=3572 RepID=A0AAW1HML6_SAPOF
MEPKKHHIVCIPAPAQGHINPMFKLAKLLHSRGFYITFVHTEFNYTRLLNSSTIQNLDDFKFVTIPDGLPPENKRGVLDLPELCRSLLSPGPRNAVKTLLMKLGKFSDVPPITCVITDAHTTFTYEVGEELGIKVMVLYTTSACGALGFLHYDELIKRGIFPLKDESYLTNGFLDTSVDWIPGLLDGAKLKHLPSFMRTTDPHDIMFHFSIASVNQAIKSKSIIMNTFDDLEGQVLEEIKAKIPNLCTIGPLNMLCQQSNLQNFGSNLWEEDTSCLTWLDKRSPNSVIYVNYGSLTILTRAQLEEFAWGLANSKQCFLWVIRNDLINGDPKILSNEYMEAIRDRGLVSGWCPQEKVLKHPSVGAFLTHCGWNSIVESISEGVPMVCWPFFADQQTNCFYACEEWGMGAEIGEGELKRGRVEEVVRDVMVGDKGKEIREKAMEWKKKAQDATTLGGSSHNNFEKLVMCIMEKQHL